MGLTGIRLRLSYFHNCHNLYAYGCISDGDYTFRRDLQAVCYSNPSCRRLRQTAFWFRRYVLGGAPITRENMVVKAGMLS